MSSAVIKKDNIINNFNKALKVVLAAAFFALATLILASPAEASNNTKQGNILSLTINEGGKQSTVDVKLRPDIAPQHVEQIKKLTKDGAYNDVAFHRVIDGFMAQTGDVEYGKRSNYSAGRVGTGGSKYANIPAEFSRVPFKRGTVGMARSQDPNSANSQFFICYDDAGFLNGKYTVVGEVVKGMDAVDRLKKGSMSANGAVKNNPDYIVKATLKD